MRIAVVRVEQIFNKSRECAHTTFNWALVEEDVALWLLQVFLPQAEYDITQKEMSKVKLLHENVD